MAIRIFGKNLNDKQVLPYGLASAVYGIGINRAMKVCEKANLSLTMRVKELKDSDAMLIQNAIKDLGYVVASDLQREERNHDRRLASIRCYRWLCRERGIPSRGQRTRSNGNTANKRKA